jgi:ABC-type amino acid transport substrate-binding protein
LRAAAAALVVCLTAFHLEARTLDEVVESGYIEIAVYRDFPPYSYLDPQGEAAGVDIDVGRYIAEGLGVEPRWFWVTADETVEDDLRNAVWKGHYLDRRVADLMMRVPYDREFSYAIDGYGAARNDMVVMFGPYQREEWILARDMAQLDGVRTLAVFQYHKIGVEIDTLPDFFLISVFGGRLRGNVVHFTSVFLALEDLRAGGLSAVAGMRSQLEWGLRDSGDRFDLSGDGLEQIVRRSWDIGLAVKHTHRQLAYAVEDLVSQGLQSGAIDAIFKRTGLTLLPPSLYDDVQ